MTRKASEPARKVRWTVPGVDTSVIEWLDKQENLSESLRLLIRESIQRDGYIDVAFKPVDQLPRRGRPPADDSQAHHSQQDDVELESYAAFYAAEAGGQGQEGSDGQGETPNAAVPDGAPADDHREVPEAPGEPPAEWAAPRTRPLRKPPTKSVPSGMGKFLTG